MFKNLVAKIESVDWDFPYSNTDGNSIHSIHPYPARFIPEIPHNLIEILSPSKKGGILDPFCGSGVSLTEAQILGYESIGIDLNPIACLLSRVKTTPPFGDFSLAVEDIINEALSIENNIDIPKIPNLEHWFPPHIQKCISALVETIKNKNISPLEKDILLVSLSSILVRVSNQDSDTRYAAINKDITTDMAYSLFRSSMSKTLAVLSTLEISAPKAKILNKDILDVSVEDIGKDVSLIVTSPPYPNAYEYWLYHKYRMFWLGYDPIQVREREIGARAHYYRKNPPQAADFSLYMDHTIKLSKEVLMKDGFLCIVVGRSVIKGSYIDNAKILSDLCELHGFKVICKIERKMRNSRKSFNLSHANIHTENILVFQR